MARDMAITAVDRMPITMMARDTIGVTTIDTTTPGKMKSPEQSGLFLLQLAAWDQGESAFTSARE
jgi:hypothetical protein